MMKLLSIVLLYGTAHAMEYTFAPPVPQSVRDTIRAVLGASNEVKVAHWMPNEYFTSAKGILLIQWTTQKPFNAIGNGPILGGPGGQTRDRQILNGGAIAMDLSYGETPGLLIVASQYRWLKKNHPTAIQDFLGEYGNQKGKF